MSTENKYYVYFLIDPETQLPFYVGKGTGKRYLDHQKNNSKNIEYSRISQQPPTYKDFYIITLENSGRKIEYYFIHGLCSDDAFLLEQAFIAWFGRRLSGNGILTNNLSGGKIGTFEFNEQALISLYNRNDLLKYLLEWKKTSIDWPLKSLFFDFDFNGATHFVERTIEYLITRGYELFAIEAIELIKKHGSVITPFYWARNIRGMIESGVESVYIMYEGLEMIRGFYYEERAVNRFNYLVNYYMENKTKLQFTV